MTVGFTTNANHVGHAVEGHPEGPERVQAVLRLLSECGLLDRLKTIQPRDATDDELALVHPPRYVEALDRACAGGGGWVDPDTYVLPESCAAARSAAGACLAATEAVLSGAVRSAFCAVRPPGHHARPDQAMGFCLLNNVAIAARLARQQHNVERVAIVDIDVHHGNGAQDAFYDDASVLYVSTHQYPYYPGTGAAEETGAGAGQGTNVNLPLPAGCGDDQYRAAFERLVEPVVRRFRPQLLLVSCGFDAHVADPLAGMALSGAGFAALARRLVALADGLCDGRAVFALEGGYDLTAIAWGARNVCETLLGEPPTPDPLGLADRPGPDIDSRLSDLERIHGLR